MKIGIIGAGKVGVTLGKYFSINNLSVTGFYSKNIDSAKDAAIFTESNFFSSVEELVSKSDIIFITTPDGVIEQVWNNLRELSIQSKIICHCSGALSSKIFSNCNQEVFGYSIHPIYAFNDKYNSYINLKQATITIEGHERYIQYLVDMFKNLGNNTKVISSENKVIYHAAAVMASNNVIALAQTAIDMLGECGFNNEEALNSLYPLMLNNVKNIGELGLVKSLTGPVERCDIKTIEKHLDSLDEEDKMLYKLLAKKLIKVAKSKNNDRDYSQLTKMIGEK